MWDVGCGRWDVGGGRWKVEDVMSRLLKEIERKEGDFIPLGVHGWYFDILLLWCSSVSRVK